MLWYLGYLISQKLMIGTIKIKKMKLNIERVEVPDYFHVKNVRLFIFWKEVIENAKYPS